MGVIVRVEVNLIVELVLVVRGLVTVCASVDVAVGVSVEVLVTEGVELGLGVADVRGGMVTTDTIGVSVGSSGLGVQVAVDVGVLDAIAVAVKV